MIGLQHDVYIHERNDTKHRLQWPVRNDQIHEDWITETPWPEKVDACDSE